MLDHDGRRVGELADEFEGRVEVEQVVVGKLLSMQDFRLGQSRRRGRRLDVQGRLLMGILAVTELCRPLEMQ